MAMKKTGRAALVDPLEKAEEKWIFINAHAKKKKPDYLSKASSDKWDACKAKIEEMKEYEQDLSNSTQTEIKELLENYDIDGVEIKVDDYINLNDKVLMPSTLKAKAFAKIVIII